MGDRGGNGQVRPGFLCVLVLEFMKSRALELLYWGWSYRFLGWKKVSNSSKHVCPQVFRRVEWPHGLEAGAGRATSWTFRLLWHSSETGSVMIECLSVLSL